MAAKKYYAVKKGKKTGIFGSWEECRASVEGFSGAEYKGFARLEEAREYLGTAGASEGGIGAEPGAEGISAAGALKGGRRAVPAVKCPGCGVETAPGLACCGCSVGSASAPRTFPGRKGRSGRQDSLEEEFSSEEFFSIDRPGEEESRPRECPAPGTLLAYVDGSYDNSLKKYAFGCVFLLPDGRMYTEYGNGDKEQSLRHRNVTGEMLGAMYAVKTAMLNGFSRVEIRYDYEGIEKWVTGAWRSKTELTALYASSMREWGKRIGISFTKVAAHSNVYYNELADKMAKTGLREGKGIPKVHMLEDN